MRGTQLVVLIDGAREAISLVLNGDPATYHAVQVSLTCTVIATLLAALLGVPLGAWLGLFRPRARLSILMLRVGMSIPTVVIGLLVFALFSRRGLLGDLDLLYTRTAIIVGEFVLALPLLAALTHAATASLDRGVVETSLTLGAGRVRTLFMALGEQRAALSAAYLVAFGRCITELGIALTVGGNLAMRTRTLPSTIQMEIARGDFARALAPGLILVALALVVTLVTYRFSGEARS